MGEDEIRLDLSDFKYPPPEPVQEAIKRESKRANLYPSGDYPGLKEELGEYLGIGKDNITLGNGLDELIDLCTRLWGGENIIPTPTFSQFEEAARREGQETTHRNMLDGIKYDFQLKEEDYGSDIIWICNPNNPTGTLLEKDEIERVVERAEGKVIVDECYSEFAGQTIVNMVSDHDNLVVLRSFSKSFGLAGLRLGAGVSNEDNIEDMEELRQPFNVNRVAAAAGRAALDNREEYERIREKVLDTGRTFKRRLEAMDLDTAELNANFLLARFPDAKTATDVNNGLEERGINVFQGGHEEFAGLSAEYIRFTIGKEEDMKRVTRELDEILS